MILNRIQNSNKYWQLATFKTRPLPQSNFDIKKVLILRKIQKSTAAAIVF